MHTRARILVSFALCLLTAGTSSAVIITTLTPGDFDAPIIESFPAPQKIVSTFDFGNGMTFENLLGEADLIGRTGGYGMGTEPSITSGGRGGPADGYFGTSSTPTTFQLAFAGGITRFGFYGAESVVPSGSLGRNGVLDIEFYSLSDAFLGAVSIDTKGAFAWDQFHGFESTDGLIGRVLFDNPGHMVLDDLNFETGVPEPATLSLVALGFIALSYRRRRRG